MLPGEIFEVRFGVSVFVRWLLGCALGGMLAALGLATEFLGQLILFGGLLALGQVGFVMRYFEERANWALAWILICSLGWAGGSVVFVFSSYLLGGFSPADPGAGEVISASLPWIFLGFGQAVILAVFSGFRLKMSLVFSFSWFIMASAAGLLITTILLHTDGPGVDPLNRVAALELLGQAARYAALIVAVYGIPTGIVLASLVARFDQARRSEE